MRLLLLRRSIVQIEIADDVINDLDLLEEVYIQLKAFRTKHKIEYSSYIKIIRNPKTPENLREGIKALFQQTSNIFNFKRSIRVVKNKTKSNNEVFTCDLNDVLSSKAVIILENEHQDLKFIKMALEVTSIGPDLNRYYNKLWSARGAGGCGDIPKLIRKCQEEQVNITRLLVVNDSDKYKQSYDLDTAQKNITDTAIECSASHVMLSKREIENYIPVSVLVKIYSPDYPKVKHFDTWSKEQKDFFDVKLGFHKKCRYDDARYGDLYRNLDPVHVNAFNVCGFGADIASQAFDMKYKQEFFEAKLELFDSDIYNDFSDIKEKLLHIL